MIFVVVMISSRIPIENLCRNLSGVPSVSSRCELSQS